MKFIRIILVFIFSISAFHAKSQQSTIDSLKRLLNANNDSIQINVLNELSYLFRNNKIDSARYYVEKALNIAKKINYEKGIARSNELIGLMYYRLGLYDKSTEYHFHALKIHEKLNNKLGIAWAYNNLANCFIKTQNYNLAQNNLQKCLDIHFQINDKVGIANSYKNFAFLYLSMNDFKKVIEFARKSIRIADSIRDYRIKANALTYIGDSYLNFKQYDSALVYYSLAIQLQQQENDLYAKLHTVNRIAATYFSMKKYDVALSYFLNAKEFAKSLNSPYELQIALKGLSDVYFELNNYKSAYLNYKLFTSINDSLFTSGSIIKITALQSQYESEKHEIEIIALNNEKELQLIQIRQQKIIIYFSIVIIILFVFLLFLQFRNIKHKKQTNHILKSINDEVINKNIQLEEHKNEIVEKNKILEHQKNEIQTQRDNLAMLFTELQQKNEEINAQRDKIELQRNELEHKNIAITDSIEYASKIQNVILPSDTYYKEVFSEYFIIYHPLAIVSGDFYWFSQIPEKNLYFTALVDCTGHGVPGAFMSMIGYILLNEIVNENKVYYPSEILNSIDTYIIKSLKQKESNNQDGMDMAVCRIEKNASEMKLIFSGAKSNLYHFQKEKNEIFKLEADHFSVGGFSERTKNFSDKEVILQKGDIIYLTSDGFIHQNNAERLKFGTRRFIEMLKKYVSFSLSEQKKWIENELENFKQNQPQRDDITVIGLKF